MDIMYTKIDENVTYQPTSQFINEIYTNEYHFRVYKHSNVFDPSLYLEIIPLTHEATIENVVTTLQLNNMSPVAISSNYIQFQDLGNYEYVLRAIKLPLKVVNEIETKKKKCKVSKVIGIIFPIALVVTGAIIVTCLACNI